MLKVSLAIACAVSCRGWRRPDRTPKTICATDLCTDKGGQGVLRSLAEVCLRPGGHQRCPGEALPSVRGRSLCCWVFFTISARVGASVPRPHATSPEKSRPRLPTLPGPAAAAGGPVPGPDGGLGHRRGQSGHPFEGPGGPGPVPGPEGPAAAATGPCCYREPSWHCRPGGGSAPSSRAAATRTLPAGGARAPVLGSGAGGGQEARASKGQAERRASSPRRRPPSWKKSWPGRASSPSPDPTARPSVTTTIEDR